MNRAALLETELQRRIDNFQKAVVAFTLNETLESAHRLAIAKIELSNFIIGAKI